MTISRMALKYTNIWLKIVKQFPLVMGLVLEVNVVRIRRYTWPKLC